MLKLPKLNNKRLLLASSIAITMSASVSFASIDLISKQDLIKSNQSKVLESKLSAYYVRYKSKSLKSQVKNQLQSLNAKIKNELNDYNTLVVTMETQKSDSLKNMAGIEFYEPVPKHSLKAQVTPWNIDQFQARDVWDKDRDGLVDPDAPDGSGVKFCIIDSGFYAAHDDFQGITHSGMSQIPGEAYTEDGSGHGTHVSGTANAMNNDIGVVGVMPGGAELVIVKVFDNNSDWDPLNSNLATAATYCKDQGANAISMSLGGGQSQTENQVFQDLYDNHNIISIAAAGNDGNDVNSYPANYDSVISVAALNESEIAVAFSQTPVTTYNPNSPPANVEWDVVEFSGGGQNVLSTWPTPDGNVPVYQISNANNEYSAGTITEAGSGDVTGILVDGGICDTVGSWSGNVVLCERGDTTFAEKLNNAADGGAVGTIIYNNVAGSFNGTCAGNCTSGAGAPGLSLSRESGLELLNNELGLSTRLIADDGSGCVGCSGGYNSISGTSMATPGVAAGIAWVWGACGGPAGITNKDLRQLLRDSAKDLVGTQPFDPSAPANESAGDEIQYGVGYDRVTGWGLVQLADALELGNQRFGSTCPIGLAVAPQEISVCTANNVDDVDYTVTLSDSFLGTSNLTATDIPNGVTGSFTPDTVVFPADTSVFTLSNLNGLAPGNYTMSLVATDANDANNTASSSIILNTYSAVPNSFNLSSPANAETNVDPEPTFSWEAAGQATSYTIEVATDANFTNIVASESGITSNSYTLENSLNSETSYYWRVKADNLCGDEDSNVFSFTTSNLICFSSPSSIPDNDANGIVTSLNISSSKPIVEMIVSTNISHTYVGDLIISLEHNGTTVELMNRPGSPATTNGCTADNVVTEFIDSDPNLVEDMCNASSPAIGPVVAPEQALSAFNGGDQSGTWNLTVSDNVGADTGTVNQWCLSITNSDVIYENGFEPQNP